MLTSIRCPKPSNSGLYAHFASGEALQVEVLQHAREKFFDRWITWQLAVHGFRRWMRVRRCGKRVR